MGKTKEWGIASLVFGLISIIPSYFIYQYQMSYEGRIDYLGNGQYIEYYPNYDVVNLMIMGMIVGFIFTVIGIIMIISAMGPQEKPTRPDYRPVQNQVPSAAGSSFCPRCGYDAGPGAIRCPRCTEVMSKVCPSCGERLPLEFNACPKCGVVFRKAVPEPTPTHRTEIVENYIPPAVQPPIRERKSEDPVRPIRGIAIGRCPMCNKILLKGWVKCQNCNWVIVNDIVVPMKD